MHSTKLFFFWRVQVLNFQTHYLTSPASFFSKKNLHRKIIEKKGKNLKITYFATFLWKTWKFISFWIFLIFSNNSKCITRISSNAKSMKLGAFESLWSILYKNNNKIIINLSCFLVALRTELKYEKLLFLWNFIIFSKFSKISFLNGNRNHEGLRQDWIFFYFQKISIISFQTTWLWCFYDQYSSR